MLKEKKQKKQKKTKKTKKQPKSYLELLPHGFVFFCFFGFFGFLGFFGSLFFFCFCFFLCFLSCRRFLCVGAMSARGLSSCICQRFAWIEMHFMCSLRTLVVPCSEFFWVYFGYILPRVFLILGKHLHQEILETKLG